MTVTRNVAGAHPGFRVRTVPRGMVGGLHRRPLIVRPADQIELAVNLRPSTVISIEGRAPRGSAAAQGDMQGAAPDPRFDIAPAAGSRSTPP